MALSAIGKIVGTADPLRSQIFGGQLGLAESLDIRSGDVTTFDTVVARVCAGMNGHALDACRNQVRGEAAAVAQAAVIQATRSLGGLQAVVRSLAQLHERKTLVLISAGLPVADRVSTDLQFAGTVASLAREASAANLNLYVLHVDSSFLDAVSSTEFNRVGIGDSLWREVGMMSAGLELLAGAGGGSLSRVVAGADKAFDRVLLETAAAYLLGVEPIEGDRDGKSHRIHVKVTVPGAEARSRAEVTLPIKSTVPATPEATLADVLRAPRLATGLPVRITTHTMAQESDAGLRLYISAELGEALTGPVDVQVGYVISDGEGRTSGLVVRQARITPRATSRSGAASFLVDGMMKPGHYVLRLAAIDAAGRAGSAEHPFSVGLTEGTGIRMGDLLLLDPLRRADEGVAPVTDGEVWGEGVDAYIEFLLKAGLPTPAGVTFGIADRPAGTLLTSLQVAPVQKAPKGPWTAGAHFSLRALTAGDYVVVAIIDGEQVPLGRVERPLRVEHR